jgi:sulfoxide reductase heme-binding subunit YedZ
LSSDFLWAIGRGTGLVALPLFTITVVLGILTRSGRPAFGLPRFAVTLVHRNTALVGSAFVVIHILTLLADPFAKMTFLDFFVPFLGTLKPVWMGFGTVAFDLMLAIVITALLRHRIGQRTFRVIHWFSYAMWPIALVHSIGNGTDAGEGWFVLLWVVCCLAVAGAGIWRLSAGFVEFSERRGAEVRR